MIKFHISPSEALYTIDLTIYYLQRDKEQIHLLQWHAQDIRYFKREIRKWCKKQDRYSIKTLQLPEKYIPYLKRPDRNNFMELQPADKFMIFHLITSRV